MITIVTILLAILKDEKILKTVAIGILDKLVKSTDNKLDDQILDIVKKSLDEGS
jgi:hypothetical protein